MCRERTPPDRQHDRYRLCCYAFPQKRICLFSSKDKSSWGQYRASQTSISFRGLTPLPFDDNDRAVRSSQLHSSRNLTVHAFPYPIVSHIQDFVAAPHHTNLGPNTDSQPQRIPPARTRMDLRVPAANAHTALSPPSPRGVLSVPQTKTHWFRNRASTTQGPPLSACQPDHLIRSISGNSRT
jgi:hypothetical protein